MKNILQILFCLFCLNSLAQKCNHAREVQTLFAQLQANGFDTKQAIPYDYYFLDSRQEKLVSLKNSLTNQGYRFVSLEKKSAKYELKVQKTESHSAQSLIQRGEELSRFSATQGVETFDGFEIKFDENPNFKEEVERISPQDLFKKAMQFYDNHEDEKAKIVLDRCIKLNINPAESFYKRANTKTALGQKTEAIADLESAIRLNASYFEANYNLAGLYFDAKDFEKSINFYQKAATINPRNDNAFYRLAAAQNQIGLKNTAFQNCQKALQINPNNAFAKELLAKLK